MQALELRIPPLVLVLLGGVAMWLLRDAAPATQFSFAGQALAAITLAGAGLSFCVAGVLSFRAASTTTNPMTPGQTSSLVTRGVYRISRNPMYVGFVFLLSGWGVYLGNALAILVLGAFIGYLTRFQIVPEERTLRGMFGGSYDTYCREVRRWI
jgi:protein-S-isoprenylcysteine O-methyltransferase Ste14